MLFSGVFVPAQPDPSAHPPLGPQLLFKTIVVAVTLQTLIICRPLPGQACSKSILYIHGEGCIDVVSAGLEVQTPNAPKPGYSQCRVGSWHTAWQCTATPLTRVSSGLSCCCCCCPGAVVLAPSIYLDLVQSCPPIVSPCRLGLRVNGKTGQFLW